MNTPPHITAQQRHILRHALGLSQKGKEYRNHFVADEGHDDFPDCERLVALGLMTRHTRAWVPGTIYCVTDAGREQARAKA